MSKNLLERERTVLINDLREAYMEIFPAADIEQKLGVLEANSYVAVTCSPTRGVGETLELTERLINAGFRVVPHIAAKNVRDMPHLETIMRKLADLKVESIFVPGGDRPKPAGDFQTALDLLRAIDSFAHDIKEIGVAAHPEGHPDADHDTLLQALREKQALAHYMVTQMCFDARLLGEWLQEMRNEGITLPAWLGLPGVIDRKRLLKTSFRIGVGDSLRFLRKKTSAAIELLRAKLYDPTELAHGLAPYQANPDLNIAGYHLFCFNQVEVTEQWRQTAIRSLESTTGQQGEAIKVRQ